MYLSVFEAWDRIYLWRFLWAAALVAAALWYFL